MTQPFTTSTNADANRPGQASYPVHREIVPYHGPLGAGASRGGLWATDSDKAAAAAARTLIVTALNNSGTAIPKGSTVQLSTDSTDRLSVVIGKRRANEAMHGIALRDIASLQLGPVAVQGYVAEARVASGTTVYQYLRQSTTDGVLEGLSQPVRGTFARAASGRDSTTGYAEAILLQQDVDDGGYAAAEPLLFSFFDDFEHHATAAALTDHYDTFSAGTGGSITTARDATTGRGLLRLTANGDAAGGLVGLALANSTGGSHRSAEYPRFKILLREYATGTRATNRVYAGFRANRTTGLQDGIYFRSTDSGNWTLVTRSGGTETTVDLGVSLSSTIRTLELVMREVNGVPAVQGYVDGVKTGSAITSNIPTGLLQCLCLIDQESVSGAAPYEAVDVFGWGARVDLSS